MTPHFQTLYKQAQLACRRGLAENEWLLQPYLESLTTVEQLQTFLPLLQHNDADLQQWLMQPNTAPTSYQSLIQKIVQNSPPLLNQTEML